MILVMEEPAGYNLGFIGKTKTLKINKKMSFYKLNIFLVNSAKDRYMYMHVVTVLKR